MLPLVPHRPIRVGLRLHTLLHCLHWCELLLFDISVLILGYCFKLILVRLILSLGQIAQFLGNVGGLLPSWRVLHCRYDSPPALLRLGVVIRRRQSHRTPFIGLLTDAILGITRPLLELMGQCSMSIKIRIDRYGCFLLVHLLLGVLFCYCMLF